MTEVSCCYKYVNWTGVFWAMLLWIFHVGKKKLMYHTRMSLESRAKEKGRSAHSGTPGAYYTQGLGRSSKPEAAVMCPAQCARAGHNCELITQCYQGSSLNGLDSLLSVFLDGWESSSCTSKCEFFSYCLAQDLNLSSFHVLKGLREAAIFGQQRTPCKAAQNLSCFNRCCFMFCQRMAPFISVMNALFLSVSKCFPVLNLILIYHSFWLIGCPFAFGASIAFTMQIWFAKKWKLCILHFAAPADFLVGWRGCISRSEELSQVIPNVRKSAEVETNNFTL